MSRTSAQLSIGLVFVLGVVASALLSSHKLDTLGFHTRDFPFYMQFASKLLDQGLTNRYSLNPRGRNLLQFKGTEAIESFHQSLHLEPIKYLFPAIYKLVGNPLSVFLVVGILQFLPLLYLARFHPLDHSRDRAFVVAAALLYAIYPSTVQAVAFDLRPFALLSPFFLILILSIHLKRPRWETWVLFNLIFLIREEALVLGMVAILFCLATAADGRERRTRTLGLIASWLSWFVVTLAYFHWTGYKFDPSISTATVATGLLMAGLCLVALWLAWPRIRQARIPRAAWQLGAYCLIFVPLAIQFLHVHAKVFELAPKSVWNRLFNSLVLFPRYHLYFVCLLTLVILSWSLIDSARFRKAAMGGLIAAIAFSLVNQATLLRSAMSEDRSADATIVRDVRRATDKYRTYILADYVTYQAFFDYEHVYVYNRLPSFMIEGERQFHPAPKNLLEVKHLLSNNVEYIVVSQDSTADIDTLLASSSVEESREISENATYKVTRLR